MAMAIEVRSASLVEIGGFYANIGDYWAAALDGQFVAIASLSKVGDRLWGCFGVTGDIAPAHRFVIVRALRRGLWRHGQEVHVTCQYPQARRLLKSLGFERTTETIADHPVWIWRPRVT